MAGLPANCYTLLYFFVTLRYMYVTFVSSLNSRVLTGGLQREEDKLEVAAAEMTEQNDAGTSCKVR